MRPQRRTVKELLVSAKDAAELMVDLAYAAVFFDDVDLGREVLRLEDNLDQALHELRLVCMLAARTPEDAERLSDVLHLAVAIEGIAGAAEEIARVALRDLGVPRELRDDLRHAAEVVARVKIRPDNQLEGRSLRDLALAAHTGMWAIAVRRDAEFVFGPGGDLILREGDVLFLQGPSDGVDLVRELAGAAPRERPPPAERRTLSNLDRAVDLCVELKNASEVAVGLAYSAILLRDRGLAAEVAVIEDRTDVLWNELEAWVLRAAAEADDPLSLRGLMHLASASERIADAAQSMTRIIEQEDLPHPVIAQALSEADEIVAEAVVAPGSAAEERTLADLRLQTEIGMEVLAVERESRWVYRPRSSRRLQVGDRILAIGPEEGAPALRAISGDTRPVGDEGWHEPEIA
ncbi:MAG: potassium channel protein [Actinobacteria bacterium]|nr:potassium channel protein [Actinomycetota bacterium]